MHARQRGKNMFKVQGVKHELVGELFGEWHYIYTVNIQEYMQVVK